jgi:hypothetical protein
MKCPFCGTNHRTERKSQQCAGVVDGRWAHYVILCPPKDVTKKRLAEYKQFNPDYFEETKKLKEKMDAYLKTKNYS